MSSAISIIGFDLLGNNGGDGLRYAWKCRNSKHLIESAAFPQRSVSFNDGICGYTTSVSAGCILRSFGEQCVFCRTGNALPYYGPLSYKDIAKQNIFMVLSDINSELHPELHNSPREFAYMGQGEPGLSYTQLRLAIELTNRAMVLLGQTVYRHIIATSGVPETIYAYKDDYHHFYTQRVTLHFSLHATKGRELLMPIQNRWSYREVLNAMGDIYSITGEKPCVGIMLFENFRARNSSFSYSNRFENIRAILSEIDPQKYRISFCEYNSSDDICQTDEYMRHEAVKALEYALSLGFEAKLFSSFGKEKQTACGMLAGKSPDSPAPDQWKELEEQTERIIDSI